MKATEQYFPVVLFIMLYKVVLTFESVAEILKCDHEPNYFTKRHLEFVIQLRVTELSLGGFWSFSEIALIASQIHKIGQPLSGYNRRELL